MILFFCTLQDSERCLETYVNYVPEQDTSGRTTNVEPDLDFFLMQVRLFVSLPTVCPHLPTLLVAF
jgi:hypothetical protein